MQYLIKKFMIFVYGHKSLNSIYLRGCRRKIFPNNRRHRRRLRRRHLRHHRLHRHHHHRRRL